MSLIFSLFGKFQTKLNMKLTPLDIFNNSHHLTKEKTNLKEFHEVMAIKLYQPLLFWYLQRTSFIIRLNERPRNYDSSQLTASYSNIYDSVFWVNESLWNTLSLLCFPKQSYFHIPAWSVLVHAALASYTTDINLVGRCF